MTFLVEGFEAVPASFAFERAFGQNVSRSNGKTSRSNADDV